MITRPMLVSRTAADLTMTSDNESVYSPQAGPRGAHAPRSVWLLRRHWRAAAAAAASVAALAVAGSTHARAGSATPAGIATFMKSLQDAQTGRCLDSNASGKVYTKPCQAPRNHYQDWFETVYKIVDPATGRFFTVWSFEDVATDRCLDSNRDGHLYTNPCQSPGNRYQDWILFGPANIYDRNTGLFLDSNAHGNAYTLRMNGKFRNWMIRTFGP